MSHDHHHHHPSPQLGARMVFSILLNLLITIAQIIGGVIAGSLALISDALHNFTDTLSLGISYFAIKLNTKANTEAMTFGYKRAEILAALFNASLLIAVSIYLVKEAVVRFFVPVGVDSVIMIWVAAIGFGANALSAFLLHNDTKKNMNVRAAYLHLFSDAVSSLAVIIAGICIYLFQIMWVDPVLTLVLVFYIGREGYGIISDAVGILMHNTPRGINIRDIEKSLLKIPGVKDVHHVHVWQLTESDIRFEGHINTDRDMSISESCRLKNEIEHMLHEQYAVEHSTLQFEYNSCAATPLIKP